VRASRVVTAGAVVVISVGSVSLSPVAQAKAATTARPGVSRVTHLKVSPVSHRTHMGDYRASGFAGAAANLPAGLAGQLSKQLGITPEQFIADGQAAADAGKVIAALRADGATVFGAKLNGTALTLTVRDADDAAAAEADGANAVIGTAQPVKTVKLKAVSSPADGSSPLLGGDLWAYAINADEAIVCSTGFNGYDRSTGAREFVTAGHCADYPHTGGPAPTDGIVYAATDSDPVTLDTVITPGHPALGSLDQSSFIFGGGQDSGIVKVTDTQAKPAPDVTTWGGTGTTPSLGVENSSSIPVLAAAAAVNGAPVCHSGERTGWQCGTVANAYVPAVPVEGETQTQTVDGFTTSVCLLPGDSGGSFVSGEYAVGVASAGSFKPQSDTGPGANKCSSAGGLSLAYPMIAAASGETSATLSAPDFELAVAVKVPVVTTATGSGVTGNGTISGNLPAPFATGTPVSLTLDGQAKASTKADSSGHWSFSLTGLTVGAHAYTVTAGSGHSTAAESGTLNVLASFTNTKAPGISGAVRVGTKVTASPGTWSVAGPTFTYQWIDNGKNITSAAGSSYTIPASLLGTKLSVLVTAHKSGYSNAAKASSAIVVGKGVFTVTVKPKLSGTPQAGKTLTVTKGTWNPLPSIKIQWYANGKPVARATGTSLKLTTALKGQTISVTVTAGKIAYVPATVKLTESTKVK
jgi:hypothetical protein